MTEQESDDTPDEKCEVHYWLMGDGRCTCRKPTASPEVPPDCIYSRCGCCQKVGTLTLEIERQQSTIDSLRAEVEHLLESNAEYQGENAALRRFRKELRGEIRELRGEVWRYQELRAACEAMTYADAVAGAEAWGRMQTALRALAQSNDTPD